MTNRSLFRTGVALVTLLGVCVVVAQLIEREVIAAHRFRQSAFADAIIESHNVVVILEGRAGGIHQFAIVDKILNNDVVVGLCRQHDIVLFRANEFSDPTSEVQLYLEANNWLKIDRPSIVVYASGTPKPFLVRKLHNAGDMIGALNALKYSDDASAVH